MGESDSMALNRVERLLGTEVLDKIERVNVIILALVESVLGPLRRWCVPVSKISPLLMLTKWLHPISIVS